MKVILPTALRQDAGGESEVLVCGATVGQALADLVERYPALRPKLLDDSGQLLSFVSVFVGQRHIRDLNHESTPLSPEDEILLVPAIAGG